MYEIHQVDKLLLGIWNGIATNVNDIQTVNDCKIKLKLATCISWLWVEGSVKTF